jgi:hypothetical protein
VPKEGGDDLVKAIQSFLHEIKGLYATFGSILRAHLTHPPTKNPLIPCKNQPSYENIKTMSLLI